VGGLVQVTWWLFSVSVAVPGRHPGGTGRSAGPPRGRAHYGSARNSASERDQPGHCRCRSRQDGGSPGIRSSLIRFPRRSRSFGGPRCTQSRDETRMNAGGSAVVIEVSSARDRPGGSGRRHDRCSRHRPSGRGGRSAGGYFHCACSHCACSHCACSHCACSHCACSHCACSHCACSHCACSHCACQCLCGRGPGAASGPRLLPAAGASRTARAVPPASDPARSSTSAARASRHPRILSPACRASASAPRRPAGYFREGHLAHRLAA
jgi:hypothetical protein